MSTPWFRLFDWFIPERSRRTKADLGRTRTFVFTHIVGPASGASIVAYLFLADRSPGYHVPVIAAGIAFFWTLPFLLRWTGNLRLVAFLSVQTLISVTLYGAYHYGGVSSPFLPWLLIALANGFFYISDWPIVVVVTFVLNLSAFVAVWAVGGGLPEHVPMAEISRVGIVSVIGATLYMAWLAVYYGRLLTSESILEREVDRHRETARRLAEARDKAEKASRDKSTFLAKMSHELRTPLNAVIGYSEILHEDANAAANVQRAADLSRINAAGKHLVSLITDILDITRIEANELKLQITAFEVKRVIQDVAATTAPLMEKNRNALVVRVAPDLGVMTSDELRLRQAVLNLLSNAAKFTVNGAVTLSARRLKASGGDWIEIEVRDTGIGIAAADLKSLFQNFKQVNSRESRKAGGTGLGLAISQSLCSMMGGAIFAESELGHGACFTIRIPAQAKSIADSPSPNPSADRLTAAAAA